MRRSHAAAISLAFLALPAAPAEAADTAPLPPGWTSTNDDEDDKDYVAPPSPRGIYGHGHADPVTRRQDEDSLCKGDSAAREAAVAKLGQYATSFWFYATASQGVLFRRTAWIDEAKPCAEAVGYRHEVLRAFVADGLVHSFEVDDGALGMEDTRRRDEDDGPYASFNPIHNLMARRPEPPRGQRSRRRIASVVATCGGASGLAWSEVCVAEGPAPVRGMIVHAVAGDDISTTFLLTFDRLRTNVRIDSRVFQVDRSWQGAGE